MRPRHALALAAVLVSASAALAQEPPPPAPPPTAPAAPKPAEPAKAPAKHKNVVSPEAQALVDSMQKLAYNPVELGLKELKGTLVMKMEMAGMEGMEGMEGMPDMSATFSVDFKAPDAISVEGKTENPMLQMQIAQMQDGVKNFVKTSLGRYQPSDAEEYDLDVATEGGAKILVTKMYKEDKPIGEMRLTVGAEGLPSKGVAKVKDPNMGIEQTTDLAFTYAKEGTKSRIDKVSITSPMLPEPMEFSFDYAPAGDFKVLSGIRMKGPMGMSFTYRYTDLTANGKKVELPAAAGKTATPPVEKKPDPTVPPAGEKGEKEDDGM